MHFAKLSRSLCCAASIILLLYFVSPTAAAASETDLRKCSDAPLIALTFDDGPSETNTARILDVLEVNGAKATFFVIGRLLAEHADVARRAVQMGCEIGNHTYDHKTWTSLGQSAILEQIEKADAVICDVLGQSCRLVRAPGGRCCGQSKLAGRPIILWSVDTEDWKYAAHARDCTQENRARVIRTATENVRDGDIILMHDIYEFTAQCCETIIPRLCAQGFRLVTVSELMRRHCIEMHCGDVYRCAR